MVEVFARVDDLIVTKIVCKRSSLPKSYQVLLLSGPWSSVALGHRYSLLCPAVTEGLGD